MHNKVLHFFPPPRFLTMPVAGISLSDTHVRAILFSSQLSSFVSSRQKGLRIEKYCELPLPVGAISAGRVNNQEEIVTALKAVKERMGISLIKASLPEEKAYLFELDMPFVEPKEVRSAIEFKLEENVPFPADQIVFDYAVTTAESEKNHLHAVVSALPAKFVSIYVDMFAAAGLTPCGLEIESQAIARALIEKSTDQISMGGYMIVQCTKQKMSLSVVSHRLVRFTSTSVISSDTVDVSGFVSDEIKKILVYWHSRENTVDYKPIQKIIICGDSFDQTLAPRITAVTSMPAEFGNVWVNALDVREVAPEISFMNSLVYASAIGLALPSEVLV